MYYTESHNYYYYHKENISFLYDVTARDTNFNFFNNGKYKILNLFDLQNLAAAHKKRKFRRKRSSCSCNREDVTNVSQNILMLYHSS